MIYDLWLCCRGFSVCILYFHVIFVDDCYGANFSVYRNMLSRIVFYAWSKLCRTTTRSHCQVSTSKYMHVRFKHKLYMVDQETFSLSNLSNVGSRFFELSCFHVIMFHLVNQQQSWLKSLASIQFSSFLFQIFSVTSDSIQLSLL